MQNENNLASSLLEKNNAIRESKIKRHLLLEKSLKDILGPAYTPPPTPITKYSNL